MTGWALAVLVAAAAVRTGRLTLGLVALAIAAAATVSLYLWPFAPCLPCGGTGRNRGSNRRRFGDCKRCGGTGRKIRPGARLLHKSIERARR